MNDNVPVGRLREARKLIKEALEDSGIKAVDYNESNIIPPVAIIVPNEEYILQPGKTQKLNEEMNVGLSILLVASRGLEPKNGDELDDLIQTAYVILGKFLDIDTASGPGQVSIKNNKYLGSVMQVQYQIKLGGE
ncbi:hypothetical protein SEA_WEASELS2_82 [Rhodococcus phage Weasels2]|uniref:Tail terminator n=1 Tax=Rhodococcus phage Weasels2 TaxID=1897437 RepID=A0A1I9SA65_9CAUD|nr:hypothetical protein FDH04_gp082 [Rhodococcus phage Weasels2]AOZ63671.1 hypothetical protein SEA_WEASELS2_82 [Rhodococcus phage Weasels2]